MSITSIKRDWGVSPSIVRITTTDAYATIIADDYLTDQADTIAALNNGPFTWEDSDLVLISYSDGEGFFTRDAVNATFTPTAGVMASHVTVFAGQETTAGGAAAEAFTVTGALATDLAFVQVVDDGTANVTVLQAVVTADTLTVTFSANPGNDAVINYQLLRAVA